MQTSWVSSMSLVLGGYNVLPPLYSNSSLPTVSSNVGAPIPSASPPRIYYITPTFLPPSSKTVFNGVVIPSKCIFATHSMLQMHIPRHCPLTSHLLLSRFGVLSSLMRLFWLLLQLESGFSMGTWFPSLWGFFFPLLLLPWAACLGTPHHFVLFHHM